MVDSGVRPESLLGTSSAAYVVLRVDLLHDADAVEDLVFPVGVYPSERIAAATTERLNERAVGRARYFYRPTRLAIG